jgi:Family of unknown function (DUF6788)
MADGKDPSRLRLALRQAEEARRAYVETILGERGPFVRGTYRIQGGRCGRLGCKCERGELHEKAALYRREDGKFRCIYVPLSERSHVDELTRRYKRTRKARAALAKLGKKSLELADALQESLLEPYPAPDRVQSKPTRPQKKRRREPPG